MKRQLLLFCIIVFCALSITGKSTEEKIKVQNLTVPKDYSKAANEIYDHFKSNNEIPQAFDNYVTIKYKNEINVTEDCFSDIIEKIKYKDFRQTSMWTYKSENNKTKIIIRIRRHIYNTAEIARRDFVVKHSVLTPINYGAYYDKSNGKVNWLNNFSNACSADQCFHINDYGVKSVPFLLNNVWCRIDVSGNTNNEKDLEKTADEFSELLIKELKEKCCGKVEPIKEEKQQQPPSTGAEKPKAAETKPAETVPQEKKAQDNKSPDSKSQPTNPAEEKKK